MATQATFQEQHDGLNRLVRTWKRRQQLQMTLLWLPRSLIPGLIAGIALLLIARSRPLLTNDQIIMVTLGAIAVSVVVMLLIVWVIWLWSRTSVQSANIFDVMFDLGERVSTALELIEGRIYTNTELINFQVQDAWERAKVVNYTDRLPLIWDWRSWLGAIFLLLAFIILLLLPNPQAEITRQFENQQGAIEDAAETVEPIRDNVATDTTLTPEERARLLEELKKATDTLAEPEVKPEEAYAALSDAESELQQQADNLNQSVENQRTAMEQAAEALRNLSTMPQSAPDSDQDTIPTLEQLQQEMNGMSEAERMETANALEQAADALQETNPEAAAALRQAAEALRQGDIQAAQEAMQEASEAMQQGQQQMQQQSQSGQQMAQNADQIRQAAEQIIQQAQQSSQQQGQQQTRPNQQQGGQEGQQQSGSEGSQQNQQGSQPQGQQGVQSQQGESGAQGEQSSEQSTSGEDGQQAGQQSQPGGEEGALQANIPGMGQDSQTQGQGEQPGQQGGSSGAGDSPGDAGSEENTAARNNNAGAAQDNDPDGTGEGNPLFRDAQRVGGESDEQIFLESDARDLPASEGEFSQNPAGQSLVPYSQVYSQYLNSANRALESDYIPLGLRDVVRDYFTSLEPAQNSGQ
jgi:hypothetical protein